MMCLQWGVICWGNDVDNKGGEAPLELLGGSWGSLL